jgi:hypothetical protein
MQADWRQFGLRPGFPRTLKRPRRIERLTNVRLVLVMPVGARAEKNVTPIAPIHLPVRALTASRGTTAIARDGVLTLTSNGSCEECGRRKVAVVFGALKAGSQESLDCFRRSVTVTVIARNDLGTKPRALD